MKIDVNSDMGEGFGVYQLCDDSALMDKVSSANIACGFHAGDPAIMTRMVRGESARRGDWSPPRSAGSPGLRAQRDGVLCR